MNPFEEFFWNNFTQIVCIGVPGFLVTSGVVLLLVRRLAPEVYYRLMDAIPLGIGLILGGYILIGLIWAFIIDPLLNLPRELLYQLLCLIAAIIIVGSFIDSQRKPAKPIPRETSYLLTGNYPPNWDEIARRVRKRDGNRCANWKSPGSHSGALHVHHIVPLSRGGTNQESNLKTLCENCHQKIHPHMK